MINYHREAVKKLEFGRFCRGFLADSQILATPQRPTCRCGVAKILGRCKKAHKSALNLYFFTASENRERGEEQKIQVFFCSSPLSVFSVSSVVTISCYLGATESSERV